MGMPMDDIADNAERWVEDWSAAATARAAKAQALADQAAQVSVSAANPDGSVEVTVTASGAMTDLRLSEAIRKRPADEVAADILATMRRAQAKLAARMAEIAAETVGSDSATGRAVVAASSGASRSRSPTTGATSTAPPRIGNAVADSSGGFEVAPATLSQHAGSIDAAVAALDQAADAGMQCAPGALAYGVLCQMLPLVLNPFQTLAVSAIKESTVTLRSASDLLREVAVRYERQEQDLDTMFNELASDAGLTP